MRREELIRLYPRLYHIAEDGSWPSIQRHGLLSTQRLLDLYQVDPVRRRALIEEHRPDSVSVHHPEHGTAVVRDQKPLAPSKLARCLTDLTVPEWLRMLNGQVFFWLQEGRMERMLDAPPYRGRPHTVLHIATAAVVAAHGDEIKLCRINSGATLFDAPARGRDSFKHIADYVHPARRKALASCSDVAELTVPDGVPRVFEMVERVERHQAGRGKLEVLFTR